MTVFKIKTSPFWQYDFRAGGKRFCGSTKERKREAAERVESAVRAAVNGPSEQSQAIRANRDAGAVYFIQGATTRLIKIGSTLDVLSRLAALQIGSPDVLTLLWHGVGGSPMEAELHTRFGAYRQHGEWFLPDPSILEFIETAKEVGVWRALFLAAPERRS